MIGGCFGGCFGGKVFSFTVREIKLPGDGQVNPGNAKNFLIREHQNDDFKICITARPLSDDWFSHEYRSISIISISDWERVYAPPSLRCYLVYEFAQAAYNRACLAPLRSAQIPLWGTPDMLGTLSAIAVTRKKKGQC